METLTPAQRIATIAIGLVLTVMAAIWVLPWVGRQIEARLPPTRTPVPATPTPTATVPPTRTPGPTPTPTVALTPPAQAVLLAPVSYPVQAPDPCNLAPLGIAFGHWGYTDTHVTASAALCPGELDTFVNSVELSEYAASRKLEAFVGVNGDLETLRNLLANGFPVIVTRWMTETGGGAMGHYQLVRGYDQKAEVLIVHDWQVGPDVELPYAQMEAAWQAYDRQYILIYPPGQAARVRAVLGDKGNKDKMWKDALAQAERDIRADEENPLAWLNKGSALVALYEYEGAKEAFDQARELKLPADLLRYRFAIYECQLELAEYKDLFALTKSLIDDGAQVEELYIYRARAYIAQNEAIKARGEYQQALKIHPGWRLAEEGLAGLPQ